MTASTPLCPLFLSTTRRVLRGPDFSVGVTAFCAASSAFRFARISFWVGFVDPGVRVVHAYMGPLALGRPLPIAASFPVSSWQASPCISVSPWAGLSALFAGASSRIHPRRPCARMRSPSYQGVSFSIGQPACRFPWRAWPHVPGTGGPCLGGTSHGRIAWDATPMSVRTGPSQEGRLVLLAPARLLALPS